MNMNESIGYKAPIELLGDVEDHESFCSQDGAVLKSYHDLANHLVTMSDSTFAHHVNENRNDFHSWVKDTHKDHHLAEKLHKSKTKHEMHHKVMGRIHELKAIHSRNNAHKKLTHVKHKIQDYMIGVVVGILIGAMISAI